MKLDLPRVMLVGLVVALSASVSIGCSAGDVAEPSDLGQPGSDSAPSAPAPPPASGTSSSGSPAATGSAADQVAAGESKFSNTCARCHGAGGEGRSGPRLVGLGSGALASFKTAEQVATFVANNMPVSSKTEAYAVVAFLLQKNGIANDRLLDATIAPTITLH